MSMKKYIFLFYMIYFYLKMSDFLDYISEYLMLRGNSNGLFQIYFPYFVLISVFFFLYRIFFNSYNKKLQIIGIIISTIFLIFTIKYI